MQPTEVTDVDLARTATVLGLDQAAPGRCSRLLLFELHLRFITSGVLPGERFERPTPRFVVCSSVAQGMKSKSIS